MKTALLATLLTSTSAMAHDAPTGWQYGYECCSSIDCRQIPEDWVKETPAGYVMKTGEVLEYTDKRVKSSPDGLTHWCTIAGRDDGRTLCLYRGAKAY